MRLKLRLSAGAEKIIREELEGMGVEISEEAELTLTEDGYQCGVLHCRDGNETLLLETGQICHIESIGHDVLVHTADSTYKTSQRLYRLEAFLPADEFIRISNSVIIRRDSVQRIRPAMSCKFVITLKNGAVVDVTRSYYYKFKEFYGI